MISLRYRALESAESARIVAWHATFNAALGGLLAAKASREWAIKEAFEIANAVHGSITSPKELRCVTGA